MGNYSKIRKPEYQIALARAERVGLIAVGMSQNLSLIDQYVEDTKKQWGLFDEMPQKLLEELEELQELMQWQHQLLSVLDSQVGQMFIEAVYDFRCTAVYR